MGFSTIGAGAVLITSLLLVTSVLASTFINAGQDHRDGLRDAWQREEVTRQSQIQVDNGNHVSGVLHLNLTNTGGTVLDGSKIHLVIDGTWRTSSIDSRTVEGTTTDVWAPGETLWLQVTTGLPQRVQVVTETGATAVYTS